MKRHRFLWCLLLTAGLGLWSGCSALKSDSDGPQDAKSKTWGGLFHRPAAKRDSMFFNEKSWEIEDRLDRQGPTPSH